MDLSFILFFIHFVQLYYSHILFSIHYLMYSLLHCWWMFLLYLHFVHFYFLSNNNNFHKFRLNNELYVYLQLFFKLKLKLNKNAPVLISSNNLSRTFGSHGFHPYLSLFLMCTVNESAGIILKLLYFVIFQNLINQILICVNISNYILICFWFSCWL